MKHLIPLLSVICSLTSCIIPPSYIKIVSGNYDFFRGEYQSAMLSYLSVPQDEEAWQYANYNVANTYYFLGEDDLAFDAWASILETAPDSVKFSVYFNQGLVRFEAGRFEEALELFTQSLLIQPDSQAARINVELAYQNAVLSQNQSSARDQDEPLKEMTGALERLLDYVSRKEAQPWLNQSSSTSETVEYDY